METSWSGLLREDSVELIAVFAAGLAAGFLNVMAGGGSLLTLPVLLFVGLPAPLANGTNRLAILVQNVVATVSFRREGIREVRAALPVALLTIPGAIAGAFLAVRVSDALFRAILAGVLVLSVIGIFASPRRDVPAGAAARRLTLPAVLSFLGIGFYGGFIQAGVGILIMGVLHGLLHVHLVRVNAWKVIVVLVFSVPALTVFIATGNVDWVTGGVLTAGTSLGAVAGARVSVRRGERAIRWVVAAALLLMAGRLALGG